MKSPIFPSTWVVTGFGELIRIQGGSQPPKSEFIFEPREAYIQLLQIRDFGEKPVPTFVLKNSVTKFCEKDDILIARYGASLGRILTGKAGAYNVAIAKTIFDRNILNRRYVFHYLQTPYFQHPLAMMSRSAQSGFSESELKNFLLPIPPLKEQERIVDRIEELFSELDKGIENLRLAQTQLAVYRQALLKHAFEGKLTAAWRKKQSAKEAGEHVLKRICKEQNIECEPLTADEAKSLPLLPDGWTYARFGNFVESFDAGKSFRCLERTPRLEEVGVAKVSAVSWGEYQESESKTCQDQTKVNPAYYIKDGDFILSRANTIDLVGACVIVRKTTQKIMLSDKTLRLSIFGLPKEYFLQFLRSRHGRKQIMKLSTGNQESMRNIGQERIRSIIVPVCSEAEASKIVERMEIQFATISILESDIETNLQKAEALRQSILKKAFAGELVAQDPADEPASVLLARIRAARTDKLEAVTPAQPNSKSKPKKIRPTKV